MKKNRMMRVASGLMVAVLMSTSAISGTFAKYVTTKATSDTARVAKFGVNIYASGWLFTDHDPIGAADDAITVQADNHADNPGDSIVAPGTQHLGDADSFTFGVSGTPEVDVKISFSEVNPTQDIYMTRANGYKDYTDLDNTDPIPTSDIPESGYYPVKYQLEHRTFDSTVGSGEWGEWAAVPGYEFTDGKKLSQVVGYFTSPTAPFIYDSNSNLSEEFGEYRIAWKWGYPEGDTVDSDIDATDKLDTYLGMKAADTTDSVVVPAGGTVNLNALIDIQIRVTQVD